MSKSGKDKQANLRIRAEVARQIRQHARSSPKAEVCGVLIGEIEGGTADVQACISGVNAAQGGAHVTFTQDTWEHIYKIKDKDYPDQRIVGWYHSHPTMKDRAISTPTRICGAWREPRARSFRISWSF